MIVLNREFLVRQYGENNLNNLTKIHITREQFRKIYSDTFKGLTKLENLVLSKNEIEEIEVGSFESLSNLEVLFLYNNKLKRIDPNTFIGLTNLNRLWLSYNEIEELDQRLFDSLSNLEELYLYNNNLKRIDSNTFNGLTELMILELHENKIEEIDVRLFESLSNLIYLRLNNNKLKRIDSNTFNGLTKLEKLELYNNKIEDIEVGSFESLSNLIYLRLYNNKLKEIDRKCFEPLKSIKVLQIYENVGLNALSFIHQSADKNWYYKDKIEIYGSISEWNKFLQQFPTQLEEKRKQEAKAKEEREREQREAFNNLKIDEENKKRAKQEQENVKATNKEIPIIDEEIKDPYIGLFLNDRYKIKDKLGKGGFGWVYLVDDTKIDIKRVREKAVKIMDQSDSVTENEIDLFSRINHENIVKYLDHFHMRIGGENKTFLIVEYCQKGDLKKKIKETKRLNRNFEERQISDWIRQSTNALNYLHSKKPDAIIHRDIKPENMLLNGVNEIKLGDLGISKLMENSHASTHAGTQVYMSPEMFKSQFLDSIYYPNTDIWSLGCVLYELIFLRKAFPQGQKRNPSIPTNLSNTGIFSSILPKMLEKDCLSRITSDKLFTELLNFYDSK